MNAQHRTVSPDAIRENAIKLIGSDWMLITAGTRESYNMMTASWGGLGMLWNKPVAFVFVRPQRYTFEFIEKHDLFTLTFFGADQQDVLDLCGSKSGREIDKMNLPGLTPIEFASGAIAFSQARIAMECRKMYWQDLTPANFLAPEIAGMYPAQDYHRMYVGEIATCLERSDKR